MGKLSVGKLYAARRFAMYSSRFFTDKRFGFEFSWYCEVLICSSEPPGRSTASDFSLSRPLLLPPLLLLWVLFDLFGDCALMCCGFEPFRR